MQLFRLYSALVFSAVVVSSSFGQNTFTTASGIQNYNLFTNWTGSVVPNAIDASAFFVDPVGNQPVQLNTAITLGSLNFTNNTAVTISLGNGTGGSLAFQVSSGNASITFNGTSTTTNVASVNASITMLSPLSVIVNNTAPTGTAGVTITGTVTGAAGIGFTKDGPGRFSFSTVAHTYQGPTIINQGRLRYTLTGISSQTSSITVNSGGMLMLDQSGGAWSFGQNSSMPITLNGAGTTETAQNLGALRNQNTGAVTLANPVALATSSTIHSESAGGSLTLNGVFSGSSTLTKTGAGTVVFTNTNNTHSGGVTLTQGGVTYNANVPMGGGNISLSQSTAANTNLRINSAQAAGTLASNWTDVTGTQTQTVDTGTVATNILTLNQSANTTFGNGAVSTLAGTIIGTGGLALSNTSTGVLTLTGANTYTGTTTVNGGTLRVNGTHTGAGIYTVNSTGTLGGSGTINGSVNVAGGILAPGNSPGLLTVNGNVGFSSTSTFAVEINGANTAGTDYDQLAVGASGSLTLNSAVLSVALGYSPLVTDKIYLTNNAFSGAISGTFDTWVIDGGSITIGAYTGNISYTGDFGTGGLLGTGNDIVIYNLMTAVPEPGAIALMGLAGFGALQWYLRRKPKVEAKAEEASEATTETVAVVE